MRDTRMSRERRSAAMRYRVMLEQLAERLEYGATLDDCGIAPLACEFLAYEARMVLRGATADEAAEMLAGDRAPLTDRAAK